MSLPFHVDSYDIKSLDQVQLTELLNILLHLEARSYGIAERSVDVSLNILVPDGGEDGRIEWDGEPLSTNYLPCNLVQFQCKATDLSPKACGKEIMDRKGIGIKILIDEVLSNDGAYIIFTTQRLNHRLKETRKKKIREKLKEYGKDYSQTAIIHVYDAGTIAGWVNKYLSAQVTVLHWNGKPVIPGLKTWEEWSRTNNFERFPYVIDVNREKHINDIREVINIKQTCARIVGLSGLGKTRLAFEIFRNTDSYDDFSERVVCIDASASPQLFGTVIEWIRNELSGILVVDNCDASLSDRLKEEIRRTDSKFSLLTIDNDMMQGGINHIINLEPVQNVTITKMLEPIYGANIPDLDRIVRFANGFPQMAVLLADARLNQEKDMGSLTNENIANKLLWGGKVPNVTHETILTCCALFDDIGLEEDMSNEYKFIADEIAKVDFREFYSCVKYFESRGIFQRRGRFVKLVPKPLAIKLAATWWKRTPPEQQQALILSNMSSRLIESLCTQISYLDFLPEVKSFTKELCGHQGPFGQEEVILSIRGSRLFRAFVEVNPESTSEALYNVLTSLSNDELLHIDGDVRRNLVWALEKLCFHKSCFEESAFSTLLLASAENESWSNNATGLFKQLFRPYLSGTEAPPELRLNVIDKALSSENDTIEKLALNALESIIDTSGGTRTIGAEYQGSGQPLEEWHPDIWKDLFDYWDEALNRLLNKITNQGMYSIEAKKIIGQNIRGLVRNGRMESLDLIIKSVVEKTGVLWPEAIESIKDSLKYESNNLPPEGIQYLNSWLELLKPEKLKDKIYLYITNPGYEHEKIENGKYKDIAVERAEELAQIIAPNVESLFPYVESLLKGEQRLARPFGRNLVVAASEWEPLFSEVLSNIVTIDAPNIDFMLGILNGIYCCDSNAWAREVERLSQVKELTPYYAKIINTGEVNPDQLDKLLDYIGNGKVVARSASVFEFSHAIEHLSIDHIYHFVQKLATFSGESAWVSLSILYMYCYQEKGRIEYFKTFLKELIISIPLNIETQSQMDFHNWQEIAEKLIDGSDETFAKELCNKILNSVTENSHLLYMKHSIRVVIIRLLELHEEIVWQVIANTLVSDDFIANIRRGHLLKNGYKKRGSAINTIRDELLWDWCEKERDKNPVVIAKLIDIWDENGNLSSRVFYLVTHYGSNKYVLSALSANMSTFMGWGSVVPHYQTELDVYRQFKDHENSEVKAWARQYIRSIKRTIKQETYRDEENDWGIH